MKIGLGATRAVSAAFMAAAFGASGCGAGNKPPASAENVPISTTDVHNFVIAWPLLTDADTACVALDPYFARQSPGLAEYRSKFGMGRRELCNAVRKSKARYARADSLLPSLDSASETIRAAFKRFVELSPGARLPSVYFVVGSGMAAGTTTHGLHPVILVGTELMRSAAGVPWTAVHELAHTQQDYPWWGMLTGGPTFLRATLLRQSLTEGTADLVAEVVMGEPKRNAYGELHERELWTDFQRDMHSRDYRGWLYNGRTATPGGRPADTGYWIGYRIAKAYYARAADKKAAIHDMLHIRDFDRFLAESGYAQSLEQR
jgi:hypothetical protein